MTSIQLLSVIACGALAIGLGLGGLLHAWLQVQPDPPPAPPEPELTLFDKMSIASAKLATEEEARLIIRATRTGFFLWQEVNSVRLCGAFIDATTELDDEVWHQLFMGCCKRALALAANPYRGSQAPATRAVN